MIRTNFIIAGLFVTIPTISYAGHLLDLILAGDDVALAHYLETSPEALAELNRRGDDGLLPLQVAARQPNPKLVGVLQRYADNSVLEPHSFVRCSELRNRNPEGGLIVCMPSRRREKGTRSRAASMNPPLPEPECGFTPAIGAVSPPASPKIERHGHKQNTAQSVSRVPDYDWSGL